MLLGVMVFEALYPSLNLSDELIQRIQGIFDTNAIEIRKGRADQSIFSLERTMFGLAG